MDRKQCVSLSVQPSRGLIDQKFIVLVQNLLPGFKLTVHAFHQCEQGNKWEAYGHYTADATGTVNVSEDPCLGGTYSGVEPMGLLWSLIPVPGSKPGQMIRRLNVQTPMEVTISVYQGHQTEGFGDQVLLASVLVERWYMAPGIRRIPITEGGLTATLFLPPGPGPFPGILDVWGFTAGLRLEFRSAMLASHGFASMTVEYLPPLLIKESGKIVDIDFDHFETAYRVLQQHPQVQGSSIAMLGFCIGNSVVLRLAAYSQIVKLRCVVCINGTHVQQVDESLDTYLRLLEIDFKKTTFNEDKKMIMRTMLLPIPTDPSLKVDVGRLQCPLLLVVGEDDQVCPAQESAMDMKEMMERAGNSHLLKVLKYPNTGHMITIPYLPHTPFTLFLSFAARAKELALMGGEMVAHCHAQEDAWRKILLFLRKNLYGDTHPGPTLLSGL
ncbi:peroxisomal succinyl-coenzyme A thioesterase-like [Hippoglossus hippoglossus]|uniref:peroxisomal succinyl-coenzyme A thioesterase-like n=1 Tax=Hippoglossus hippoglossus TaxID=8267 RepID=UPI00148D2C83|nr:peroxisomal succinyl-coenzyme A thioesterase-like [Hippoglossus hippoglossus]